MYDYSNSGNPPELTGYTLSNGVSVTIRDLDKLGDAIDGGLAAGATTLDGVTFRVDDPAKAQDQARKQAMAQATSMADTLASRAPASRSPASRRSARAAAHVPYPIFFDGAKAQALAADSPTRSRSARTT